MGTNKPVDEYRSIVAQLTAARKRAIKEVAELKTMDDEIRAKTKEIAKMRDDLYRKSAAASPTVAELEKKKAALDAERKRKKEEQRKARGQEGQEAQEEEGPGQDVAEPAGRRGASREAPRGRPRAHRLRGSRPGVRRAGRPACARSWPTPSAPGPRECASSPTMAPQLLTCLDCPVQRRGAPRR